MRRHDREVTDGAQIDAIIDRCDCCRIALNAPEGAYIVPMNFGFEPGAVRKFYFHSASEGRKVEMIGSGVQAGFELDCGHKLHEAESACAHSYAFCSVIGTGRLAPVEAPEEKKQALERILAHYRKDRAFSVTLEQARSVAVFCLTVETISCKEHL